MGTLDGVSTIQGRLVSLRPISREDYPVIFGWRSSIETVHMLNFTRRIASFEEFVHEFEALLPNSMFLLATERANRRPIGYGVAYRINPWDRWIAVVMYVEPRYRATGHGGEAALLCVEAIFQQFPVEKIVTEVYGFASSLLQMIETMGFEETGRLPNHYWHGDRAWDMHAMALTRERWLSARERFSDIIAVQKQMAEIAERPQVGTTNGSRSA